MRIELVLCSAFALCACSRGPASYRPPAQFRMPATPESRQVVAFVKLNELNSLLVIQDGVFDAGHGWGFKWTSDRANFRFVTSDLKKTDFYLYYALDPQTFGQRGPVRIAIQIDGKPFDSFVESVAGEHTHRHPADELSSATIRTLDLSLQVDPPWVSSDGTKFGIFAGEIGFIPGT